MKIKLLPVILALISFFCGTILLGIWAYNPSVVIFLGGIILYAICIFCCIIGMITAKEITQKILNS